MRIYTAGNQKKVIWKKIDFYFHAKFHFHSVRPEALIQPQSFQVDVKGQFDFIDISITWIFFVIIRVDRSYFDFIDKSRKTRNIESIDR